MTHFTIHEIEPRLFKLGGVADSFVLEHDFFFEHEQAGSTVQHNNTNCVFTQLLLLFRINELIQIYEIV